MALSKPCKITSEVIEIYCVIKQEKATSLEMIEHLIGGPNMEYCAIELENSFECYDFLRSKLDEDVRKADKVWYFEEHKLETLNAVVTMMRNKAEHGVRQHFILRVIVRMTLPMTPKIGYCRMFEIPGRVDINLCVHFENF